MLSFILLIHHSLDYTMNLSSIIRSIRETIRRQIVQSRNHLLKADKADVAAAKYASYCLIAPASSAVYP
jgi:hypothetical protein